MAALNNRSASTQRPERSVNAGIVQGRVAAQTTIDPPGSLPVALVQGAGVQVGAAEVCMPRIGPIQAALRRSAPRREAPLRLVKPGRCR